MNSLTILLLLFVVFCFGVYTHINPCEAAVDDPTLKLKVEGGYHCVVTNPESASSINASRVHGGYMLAEVSYALTSTWVIQTGYQGSWFDEGRALHRPHLGIRYQLDVFKYIPWLGLIAGYDLGRTGWKVAHVEEEVETGASTRASEVIDGSEEETVTWVDPLQSKFQWGIELGVDWQLDEVQGVGLTLRWLNLPNLSGPPGALTLGVNWAYSWVIFDPFN